MCGIIGYTGHRPAIPAIVEGLRRLEYRGYDSSGVAYEECRELRDDRSEERRVGKECRSRWSPYH